MGLDEKQLYLIDHNYFLSMGLLMSNSVLGEFFDCYEMSIINCGIPEKQFNLAFIKRITSNPEDNIKKWEQYFNSRNFPFQVIIRPGLEEPYALRLEEKGYKRIESIPAMVLFDLPDLIIEKGNLHIKKVVTPTELGHFQTTGAKGFSLPDGAGPFVITQQTLDLPNIDMFIGYAEGEPVCTSMLIITGNIAGIYWVSTLEKYRNQGFAEAITWQSIMLGKAKGCKFASLQASKLGVPVYKRMGFSNPFGYIVYSSPE